jgi:hypothetical protein
VKNMFQVRNCMRTYTTEYVESTKNHEKMIGTLDQNEINSKKKNSYGGSYGGQHRWWE